MANSAATNQSHDGVLTLGLQSQDSLNISFVEGLRPEETKMFSSMGENAYKLTDNEVLFNNHNWGIAPEQFENDEGLKAVFKMTSVSYGINGLPFAATMEAYDYPFYGS